MAEKLHSRALKYDYTVLGNDKSGKRGVEACVDGLAGLYEGKNTGKTLVSSGSSIKRSLLMSSLLALYKSGMERRQCRSVASSSRSLRHVLCL